VHLTEKQKAVYQFIKAYIEKREIAPSYEEIRRHFGFRSYHSVQKYLQQLERKGYIVHPGWNLKRAIRIVEHGAPAVTLPLVGVIAAGEPIEAIEQRETIDVPESLLGRRGEHYALRVKGDSMIGDGIYDGDLVIVREQPDAQNGQVVVALLEGEATVKRFFKKGNRVELRPANPRLKPLVVKGLPGQGDDFRIQGVVVALIRQFLRQR